MNCDKCMHSGVCKNEDRLRAVEYKFAEDIQNTAMGIIHYFSYLETVGFKLAHYFGFAFADRFLGHVVPGYAPDSATTTQYAMMLQEYLDFNLSLLD